MANIQIIQGDFEKKLKLQFAPSISAGSPSPAEDYNHETQDFNRDLIRNPEVTFYGKAEGDSMIEACINDGDIAGIDHINKVNGTETIVLGSLQYAQKTAKERRMSLPTRAPLACNRRDARTPSSMISRIRTQPLAGVTL